MSVTIPTHLLHELISLVEDKLQCLDNLEASAIQALQEIHAKTKELAEFERNELSSPAATIQCSLEAEAPLNQEMYSSQNLEDEASEVRSVSIEDENVQVSAPTVRKRRKRVSRKISQVCIPLNIKFCLLDPNFSTC